MRTILALLILSGPALAATDDDIRIAMAMAEVRPVAASDPYDLSSERPADGSFYVRSGRWHYYLEGELLPSGERWESDVRGGRAVWRHVPAPAPKQAPAGVRPAYAGQPSNRGWCACQANAGACYCIPASICPKGCPINQTIGGLRAEDRGYYFPAVRVEQVCPPGRP